MRLTSLEICAGAGGQALGLEKAGFDHLAVVELDAHACATLRHNRPKWNVIETDLHKFHAGDYRGVDLFAGGVPCPPFSKAGKQLGYLDDRDLFPVALKLIKQCDPKAVLLENVRGLLDPRFDGYREQIQRRLEKLGYRVDWRLVYAADYGVPQLRPRTLLVAIKEECADHFGWPEPRTTKRRTVGKALKRLMAAGGWEGVDAWTEQADRIGPTLVGGSKKHGGPDLGPTRARKAWAELGVDGLGLADAPPAPGFTGMPRLTVDMAAVVQGFPRSWKIVGRKTNAYRQVGNAFPPPVAEAVGRAIAAALIAPPAGAHPRLERIEEAGRLPQTAAA